MSAESIDFIEHDGVVRSVERDAITVAISDSGDCGACPAAKLCNAGQRRDDVLRVPVGRPSDFEVGQKVVLRGSERLHRRAIMLATVIPSIILVGIMFLVWFVTYDQLAACLSALGAMLVFFFALYLLRNRMEHEFSFEVVS